jgi:hypothetical protein
MSSLTGLRPRVHVAGTEPTGRDVRRWCATLPVRFQRGAVAACAVIVALILGLAAGDKYAFADTQYGPSSTGKTYRNNWASSCQWWNGIPGGCYLGVWSDTTSWTHVVEVKEWAENLHGSCLTPPFCTTIWTQISPWPSTGTAMNQATTSHYDTVDNPPYPSATRGYASHRDWSYNGGVDVYWTSDGY